MAHADALGLHRMALTIVVVAYVTCRGGGNGVMKYNPGG